jgi:hypothetical protein
VPSAYSYVDGASLVDFIFEVRKEFLSRSPRESDDRHPNSLRLVAIDTFESMTTEEQLAVWRDLIDDNPALHLARDDSRDIFEFSDAPAAYLTDLTCEVICQILYRDRSIREEDNRRLALVMEAADEWDGPLG